MLHADQIETVHPRWHDERDEPSAASLVGSRDLAWYVLWTRSHCEQLVFNQLTSRGYALFLPRVDRWSSCNGRRSRLSVPAFPGYLFLRHEMNTDSCLEARNARGVVRILSEGDRFATIPGEEIDAIRRALCTDLPAYAHPYLKEGQRVRITSGPLTNVEGLFVRDKPNKGLLVLSVNLLRGSVAVEMDYTQVVPV